jgi:hypothetical protein
MCQMAAAVSILTFGYMWYLYTMEFYAAMIMDGKWMELENIILSEVSLAPKTKNRVFSLICGH